MTTTPLSTGAYNTYMDDLTRRNLEADLRAGNPEDTARLLEETKALIEDPKHWIKGLYHDEIDGERCYCLDGALMAADDGEPGVVLSDAYWAASAALYLAIGGNIVAFNDDLHTGHADVLAALDKAIEKVKA